jgi:deazaflavin-dependent oxidoreductase (nitroreductase family)
MNISEAARWLARATGPALRPLAGRRFFPLWGVVHHAGRRSGQAYATPVVIRVTPDAFVIPLPFGPGTQWTRNVQAAGSCTVRWEGVDWECREPQIISAAEAEEAFSGFQRAALRALGADSFLRLRRVSVGRHLDELAKGVGQAHLLGGTRANAE